MQQLRKAIDERAFILDLDAQDMESIIHLTLDRMFAGGLLDAEIRPQLEQALLARERQVSTAIGHAVAVPHAYLDGLPRPLVVFVRLAHPVNLDSPDGIPTRFAFFLLGPTGSAGGHLDTLATVARLMSDDEFRYELLEARNQHDLLTALDEFQLRTAPPARPPARVVPEGLHFSGRPFGGILQDIRRRLPFYNSDFRDGLHPKCISATTFLFFACLAPAVTFGGIMGVETGGQIGVVEMLVGSATCGIIYALFCGQPLIILGGIGPLLIFTAILYRICQDWQLPFLPTYAWVGLWTAFLLILLAITEASCWMRYFTRFSDEIFSALVALMFIYEAIRALVEYFHRSFTESETNHDSAFLSLILALGTFFIATNLARFRSSRYLLPTMREFLSDFGPTLALCAMALVGWLLRDEVALESLQVPTSLQTSTGRPWLVDLTAAPTWARWGAVGPAVLATMLIFFAQNITGRLINSPDHKLHKGEAYHLDLALVGLMVGGCSLFGLPWLVAATVRSLAHVRGLATVEEVVVPGGPPREQIIHVRENRVSGLAIHVLLGLSLLLLPLFKTVPLAALLGLFLFMGVVSLSGNQFIERLSLWLMDRSLYPQTHYTRRVSISNIHWFTLLQFLCLVVLCGVSLLPIAEVQLLFPLFIALLVPARMVAGRIFPVQDLAVLDADELPEEEATHWSH